MREGITGATATTPQYINFGAGTIHKGLKYVAGSGWNFTESIKGATNGGNKLSIIPEIYTVPVDGMPKNTKGLKKVVDTVAKLEVNFIEVPRDVVMAATFGKEGESDADGYDMIVPKEDITDDDYWENVAYVGVNLDNGKKCIAILDNPLITSGWEREGKSNEASTDKFTFECHADLANYDGTMPWRIYYPQVAK